MATVKITELFDAALAAMLAGKIMPIHSGFDAQAFIAEVDGNTPGKTYTQRIGIIADALHRHLPRDYEESLDVLTRILGPENPKETGMFTNYYWILPIGKYIERYGLDHFHLSMNAIAEVTKRNTGEYAVRPYLRRYPADGLKRMRQWALSDNFHLRRLASEGLRPRLPWAPKLDVFIDQPAPVFEILELLKEERVRFVRKSVANHLADYLKVRPEPTLELIDRWRRSDNEDTQWIVRHATRKFDWAG